VGGAEGGVAGAARRILWRGLAVWQATKGGEFAGGVRGGRRSFLASEGASPHGGGVLEEIKERFNAFIMTKGLRRTRQREVIVEAAFGTKEHYTAEELWEMARKLDRTASRATVYRTLALLVECGLLREIDLGKDVVCYDPNFLESPDHNHLICLDCEKVVEFEDAHISVLEDCISRRLGFTPTLKAIRIEARCDELRRSGECRQKKRVGA
jgi:Fur family transcriptional regulator, ferric uptake regulator